MSVLRPLLVLIASPRTPQLLRSWAMTAGATALRHRLARADRRQARQVGDAISSSVDGHAAYVLDAYHGGVTFWDWIGVPNGGLWYIYNWPVVGRTVVERTLRYPKTRAVLEFDAHTYEEMARRAPDAIEQMRRALATGRVEIANGAYGQPLAQTVGGESLLRHFMYGLAAVREALGVTVDSYLAQEPQFFVQMPQVLAGFGYRRALLRTHWAPFGTDPAADATVVRWRGPDGTELPTVPRYAFMNYDYLQSQQEGVTHGGITGLDIHAWDGARIRAFAREARTHGVDAPLLSRVVDLKQPESPFPDAIIRSSDGDLRFVTLREYFDLAHNGAVPRVTFGPDDIRSTIPWGLGGDRLQRELVRAEEAVLMAERLDALAFALGRPSEESRLDEAWKSLLLAQHHDLHVCGPSTSLRHGRTAFDVACGMARTCSRVAREVIEGGLTYLASKVDTSWVRGTPLLVFNPSPWRRTDYVQTSAPTAASALLDENGREVPVQTVAPRGNEVLLGFAVEVPAMGYRVLDLRRAEGRRRQPFDTMPEHSATALGDGTASRNGHYSAALDDRGSLRLEVEGQPLLEAGGYLTAWKDGAWHDSRAAGRVTVECDGPVFRRWLVEGQLAGVSFRQWITMYRALPRIDVRLEADFADGSLFGPPAPDPSDTVPYYLQDDRKLCVNLQSTGGRCVHDAAFLISEAGGPHLTALTWAGVEAADGQGLAYLHRGTMGCHLDEDRGLLRNVLAWSPERWLYGGGNFVEGEPLPHTVVRGRHTYEYAVLPYTSRTAAARRAADYRLPLLVIATQSHQGELAPSGSFLELEPEEAILTAMFVRRGGVYARLWNASPQAREADLRGGSGLRLTAVRLDLTTETPVERPALRPWGLRTLRLDGLGAPPPAGQRTERHHSSREGCLASPFPPSPARLPRT